MKVVKIEYPTALSKIEDVENDNIDVFVELEDGFEYVVVVFTPKNYYWYMDKEDKDYFCGCPNIVVKKLTHENISKAIEEYASGDAYWLKYYHLSGGIDIGTLNKFIEDQRKSQDEIMSLAENLFE